jgi:calcineurin-like phosphoesterase family protein
MERNLWFTADLHLGHKAVLGHGRGGFDTIEEHDEAIVANWNSVVGDRGHEVWVIGDFCFRNKVPFLDYFNQLNGTIHFIMGNHDEHKEGAWRNREHFASANRAWYMRLKPEKINIYMHHYGCRVWRSSHHGSWHLYGHSHGDLPPFNRSMDVGVDAAAALLSAGEPEVNPKNYRPIHFDEVREFMKDKPVTTNHPDQEDDDDYSAP